MSKSARNTSWLATLDKNKQSSEVGTRCAERRKQIYIRLYVGRVDGEALWRNQGRTTGEVKLKGNGFCLFIRQNHAQKRTLEKVKQAMIGASRLKEKSRRNGDGEKRWWENLTAWRSGLNTSQPRRPSNKGSKAGEGRNV